VVSEQHLTSMYALSSYDPDIVNAVCEIKPVGLADGLEQLSAEDPTNRVAYSPQVLQRLRDESQEFERRGIDVTFDLLRLLRDRFSRAARESGVSHIDLPQYEKIGGLLGVVREHVNGRLDALETVQPRSDALARAILDRVLAAQSRGGSADFDEIAARFEVSNDVVRAVVDQLSRPDGLLLETAPGKYQFQPPQVAAIIEEDAGLRQLQNERALRIIEEGLRSRQQLGTFLPPVRFAEIHRQRHHLVVDDALKSGTHIGPAVDQSQLDQDLRYIGIGKDEGARLVAGGDVLRRDAPGFYVAPALFTDVRNDMRIAREEIFGPVAAVIRAKDYDAALAIANDTPFGLVAGICTTSLKHATHFKRNAEAGMVMVNLPTAGVDYHVPFGGRKGSSYGPREQGRYAAEFYTTVKTAYTLA